jgi:hypothetical protein
MKLVQIAAGAEALLHLAWITARLKPCPDASCLNGAMVFHTVTSHMFRFHRVTTDMLSCRRESTGVRRCEGRPA